jgi:hypothetical protein
MPGTRSQAKNVIDAAQGYSSTAVAAAQVLSEFVSTSFGRISGIKFYAVTAGSGACVGDVLLNGTSIWSNAASKPTLAAGTGEFTNSVPDPGSRGVRPGDRITIQINTIGATGPARVMATVALEANA